MLLRGKLLFFFISFLLAVAKKKERDYFCCKYKNIMNKKSYENYAKKGYS